jgi:predicted nucleic acid-binding protein
MTRILLDTNIVLDLLGEREPFYEAAAKLFFTC